MKTFKMDDMVRGWFVGNFSPTAFATNACEVAVKVYKAGDKETPHYHKIATETTMILYGEVEMNGIRYKEGDIIVVEPNEIVAFSAVTDSSNVVIKVPAVPGDKYVV